MGAEAVVRAVPDGYTLLYATTANAINAALYEKLNFNFLRDITPVASTIRDPTPRTHQHTVTSTPAI
jgi:tripartite-type tricarboxylate transporter receptor subunit TctC